MARYAIKHKTSEKIFVPSFCESNVGELFNESDYFHTWGTKQDAEDALTNLKNRKQPIYIVYCETETGIEHSIDEFELVEL